MAHRIFISDKMSDDGLDYFKKNPNFEVHYDPEVSMADLAVQVRAFDALVIRSRTTVSREMLAEPGLLKIIGRAGAGVDNVDTTAATEKGIIVMNTPGGNTVSTAEHAISMMLSLARRIPYADATMHAGQWDKKSIVGVEMFEKTLGIIGLGKIGRVVAERMRAFGMNVLAFDPFLTAEQAEAIGVVQADVDTICEQADVITVHAPLNDETRNIINAERLAKMKKTTLLVNCARGGLVDEAALLAALQSGKLAGAAMDVFEVEPLPADHPFRTLKNVVLTPHLAASTTEAQEKVATQVADQIDEALSGGVIRNAVNAPSVDAQTYKRIKPELDLCERIGRFMSQFSKHPVNSLEITYSGSESKNPSGPLTTAVLMGYLKGNMSENVNAVNAGYLAKQLGIKISETRAEETGTVFQGLITLKTVSDDGSQRSLSGTINMEREPRFVIVDQKRIDAIPAGHLLVIENRDVPGIIGLVGTILGNHQINIASMDWGRVRAGEDALTVINVDQPVSEAALEEILKHKDILSAKHIVI